LKLTCYTAGAIEHVSNKEMKSWREDIAERLRSNDLAIFDPVFREAQKAGLPAGEQVKYIQGLKQGGHIEKFLDVMKKIWWGIIPCEKFDRIRLLIYLREKSQIEGNYDTDLDCWADYEAVVRSNFVIMYLPKDIKTVGTYFEAHTAYLLGIPIYLILPDQPKTEANSTLLSVVLGSKGEIFYSVKDCCEYIITKYKIKIHEVKK
jgi:hypothetical protein